MEVITVENEKREERPRRKVLLLDFDDTVAATTECLKTGLEAYYPEFNLLERSEFNFSSMFSKPVPSQKQLRNIMWGEVAQKRYNSFYLRPNRDFLTWIKPICSSVDIVVFTGLLPVIFKSIEKRKDFIMSWFAVNGIILLPEEVLVLESKEKSEFLDALVPVLDGRELIGVVEDYDYVAKFSPLSTPYFLFLGTHNKSAVIKNRNLENFYVVNSFKELFYWIELFRQ